MSAVSGVTPSILEPVQALNAQPMDLNLGPQLGTPPEIDGVPNLDRPMSDSALPPSLVPLDPRLTNQSHWQLGY